MHSEAVARTERRLRWLTSRIETSRPQEVAAEAAELARAARALATARGTTPAQRRHADAVRGRIAVVRADAAYKADRVAEAYQHLANAAQLAAEAGDPVGLAAARRIEALVLLYEGRFAESRLAAERGLTVVGTGPQAAALHLHAARAAAELPDPDPAVDRHVEQALRLMDAIGPAEHGSPGLAFDELHPVDGHQIALTAYAAAGRLERAREHELWVLPAADAMGATGHAVATRLALATALARKGQVGDACRLAAQALAGARLPTRKIAVRVAWFLEAAPVDAPEVADVAARFGQWRVPVSQPTATVRP